MRAKLPTSGRSKDAILAEMRGMKAKDVDWQHGRAPLFVFKATDELYEMGRDAFFEFFTENALGAKRAFRASIACRSKWSRWRSACSTRLRRRRAS